METVIGIIVFLLGMLCWIGQSLALFSLPTAIRLGLFEAESEVDGSLYQIERLAEGIMDFLLCWMLPVSGLMMVLEIKIWPILALVGGGVYLYFPGLIILSRIVLKRQGKKIGSPSSEKAAYLFGTLWALSALIMIWLAVLKLEGVYLV